MLIFDRKRRSVFVSRSGRHLADLWLPGGFSFRVPFGAALGSFGGQVYGSWHHGTRFCLGSLPRADDSDTVCQKIDFAVVFLKPPETVRQRYGNLPDGCAYVLRPSGDRQSCVSGVSRGCRGRLSRHHAIVTIKSVDEIPNKDTSEQIDFDMAGHVKVTI